MEIGLDLPHEYNPHLISPFQHLAGVPSKISPKGPRMGDFALVEETVAATCANLESESESIGKLLSALELETPFVEFEGVRYQNLGPAPKTFRTIAGDVTIVRCLFRSTACRNRPTIDPVALRAGAVGDGWLRSVAKAMALHLATVTSRKAAALSTPVGRLPYSRSGFERVGHLVGHLVGAAYCRRTDEVAGVLTDKFVVSAEAASVSVSLDRVAVPLEEIAEDGVHIARHYRMAHCGTLTFHAADCEALHVTHYGRVLEGDISGMDELMQSDLRSALADSPGLHIVPLVGGASELWTRLDRIVEGLESAPTRLVDFWHRCEHLGAAAATIDEAESAASRLTRWRHLLLNTESAFRLIVRDLDQHMDLEAVAQAIGYHENQRDRLNYARARGRGHPIGSGNVEATCKSLVSQRFKQLGDRWKCETGEHVFQLRALQLCDHWEDAMKEILGPLPRRVVPRAA